jgi:thiamine-monophosphate kinase
MRFSPDTPLGEIGELPLLDWVRKKFASRKAGLLLGIGDDAAALRAPAGELLYTSDLMCEGVHFDLRYWTPCQLGFKLVSVNASDIYAMGGAGPVCATFELAAPAQTKWGFIEKLYEGVGGALALYGAALAGGDVSASKSGLVLGMSMIGKAGARVVSRAGARTGDGIFVTGPLGEAACGMELLKRTGHPVNIENGKKIEVEIKVKGARVDLDTALPLLRRHLMPRAKRPPRVSGKVPASAMLDVSDGLLIDLYRLCKESGKGAIIYERAIPITRTMRKASALLGLDPLRLALGGGEDYELLYTARKGGRGDFLIGEITAARGIYIEGPEGRRKKIEKPPGYEHFKILQNPV